MLGPEPMCGGNLFVYSYYKKKKEEIESDLIEEVNNKGHGAPTLGLGAIGNQLCGKFPFLV